VATSLRVVRSILTEWAKGINPPQLPPAAMGDIASIRANQNATFAAEITAISTPREVTTSRGTSSVADATLQDATGTTTLTLWGDDITKYKVGTKIQITDGWVKDFKGKLQVSLGRSGKITVVP
jgi:ssDNA-binding replication factor A large subunit